MMFIADENFPRPAVEALRRAGMDAVWIAEASPGAPDDAVLNLCRSSARTLLTFDKDFGELAYRRVLPSECGIVLFRVTPQSPEEIAAIAVSVSGSGVLVWPLQHHDAPEHAYAAGPSAPAYYRALFFLPALVFRVILKLSAPARTMGSDRGRWRIFSTSPNCSDLRSTTSKAAESVLSKTPRSSRS